MIRLLGMLATVAVLALGVPPVPSGAGDDCCPTEESGGHCPPFCAGCACCPGVRPLSVQRAGSFFLFVPPVRRFDEFERRAPIPPDPREILHVPRTSAA